MTKFKKLLLSSLVIFSLLIMGGCTDSIDSSTDLELHFIDVGQGDSTFIKTPGGYTMLIDAGDNSHGSDVVNYIKGLGVKKIDVLIGTHPDADHIGGIDNVIDSFEIGEFYMPKKTHTTKTYADVLNAAKNSNLKIKVAVADKIIPFDPDTKAVFLSPENQTYSDNNSYSAVIKLTYDQNSFLLTGDTEKENEAKMINKYGISLQSDLIKLAHHGSSTSNTPDFLDAVNPQVAVTSCGYKNKYSHPHKEILSYLEENDIVLYRTDEQGDIIVYSDGQKLSVNQEEAGSYEYRKANKS
ncbi:MAG: ComEC/Rec2 family competence protein [Proteocatella sp.]